MKQISYELNAGILTISMDGQTLSITNPDHALMFVDRIRQMERDWNWQIDSLWKDMEAKLAEAKITAEFRVHAVAPELLDCTKAAHQFAAQFIEAVQRSQKSGEYEARRLMTSFYDRAKQNDFAFVQAIGKVEGR